MAKTTPPNVLIIMSDQHHPRFMGCAGHPLVRTPHLDGLAAEGTRFSSAYCNSPLCGPSRMSFMTARYPSQIDCLTNHDQLSSDIPTFAHAFGAADYETLLCGRMHFNGPDQRHGFHRRLISDVSSSQLHPPSRPLQAILGPLSGTTGPSARAIRQSGRGDCGYLAYDEKVTDVAVEWLQQRPPNAGPFMMTVGFVQPHAPFVARPEDYDRYDPLISERDLPDFDPEQLHPELRRLRQRAKLDDPAEQPSLEDQRRARVAYHGMCTFLDRQTGRILEALKRSGLADHTLVVYTSDHGEQLGEHGMWWKHTFYESSVGVPMIMAGPGVPSGKTIRRPVSLIDLGPTLLDSCGAPALPGAAGKSFRSLLDDADAPWPDLVLAENLWPAKSDCLHRMVRRGPWKFIEYPGFAPQLFNLEDDPTEVNDLAGDPSFQDLQRQLQSELSVLPDTTETLRRIELRSQFQPWIKAALTRSDLPEPDDLWYDEKQPPTNWYESGGNP